MDVILGDRLQGVMALSREVAAALDVEQALRAVTRATSEITSPSAVCFWVADDAARTLAVAAVSDEDLFADFPVRTIRFDQGLVGEVARSQRVVRIPDVFADPRIRSAEWHRRHGFLSCDAIPIVFQDATLGVLAYSRHTPFPDGDDTLDVLTFFVDHAAIAIRNAKRLETLLEVNRQLSSIQSVDALIASIARACGRLLGSDSVAFRLVEGDEMPLIGTWGDASTVALKPRIRVGESLSGVVAATGRPLNLANAVDDPRNQPYHRTEMERLGYRAWLGVPVKLGERVMGVLGVRTRRAQGFSASDVSVATAFAAQAA